MSNIVMMQARKAATLANNSIVSDIYTPIYAATNKAIIASIHVFGKYAPNDFAALDATDTAIALALREYADD